MPLPKGYTLDPPAAQPAMRLPAGYTLDAPAQPAAPATPTLTDNPNGEGTYAMWDTRGKMQQVPYSNVQQAKASKYVFDLNANKNGLTPQQQYEKDVSADTGTDGMRATPSFGEQLANLLTHPVKSLRAAATPISRPANASIPEMAATDVSNVARGATSVFAHPWDTAKGAVSSLYRMGPGAVIDEAQGRPTIYQDMYDQANTNGPQFGAYSLGQGIGTAGTAKMMPAPVAALPGKIASVALRGAGNVLRYAASTPEGRAAAMTRAVTYGSTPEEMLTRALKPSVAYDDFSGQVNRALPAIDAQAPGPGVKGFSAAAKAAQGVERAWYEGVLGPNRGRPANFQPVVTAEINSVPTIAKIENPNIMPRTVETAERILPQKGVPGPRRTLGLADQLRIETNQKLQSLWNKASGDRYAALADPETARVFAQNNALRDLTYGDLSDASGIPEAEIRRRQNLYGDLSDVSTVAGKRATVFGRQNPISLQESIGMSSGSPITGVANWARERVMKKATNSDALVNGAMDRYRSPGSPVMPQRPGVVGSLVGDIGNILYGAGKVKSSAMANPLVPYGVGAMLPKPASVSTDDLRRLFLAAR